MAVQNANRIIREARQKAGLTQEEMSEGICSSKVLSRIETGAANVSHATFRLLMERAGTFCNAFPAFDSREDFECFYALKHARFHLDAWKLDPAYEELQKVEDKNWADSKLHYQEWLLLHCQLQFRSYRYCHRQNYDTLLDALHITRPKINLSDLDRLLLSQTEIRLLTALAQEAVYLGRKEECKYICRQLGDYLVGCKLSLMEKERLQAENAIVYTKYLIAIEDYKASLETAEKHRHIMAANTDSSPLFELTFLTGLCCYKAGDKTLGEKWIKAAFYSAHAIESCYSSACRDYLKRETDFPITGEMSCRPDIPLKKYDAKRFTNSLLSEFCDNFEHSYTLGQMISDLRWEQKIPQSLLCQGLCSKSKLSKIENGSLQPDIMLAEALLQRLGMPDRIFTFWGNEKDAKFHDISHIAIHKHTLPKEKIGEYLNEMETLFEKKEILYYQEYLFLKAVKQEKADNRTAGLIQALQLTLPDFDISQICSYRLTWCELTILNNLAKEYRLTNQTYWCSIYASQIVAYFEAAKPDIMLQKNILPFTYSIHCRSLYLQKLYHQVLDYTDKINLSILKCNISAYGGYLFFYSQALGECACFETAQTLAVNAYAIDELTEYPKNSVALKRYFIKDFSITLNY